MRLDEIELARRARDLRVAEVMGLDPAFTYDIDVRKTEGAVWWRHTDVGDWPEHQSVELASGEYPRLGRVITNADDWEEITKADDQFAALFETFPVRWLTGMGA